MRIDCREMDACWDWKVFDRDTGKDITSDHIVAVDDSLGQIIKYESRDGKILHQWPLISEIRNVELVYTEWPK